MRYSFCLLILTHLLVGCNKNDPAIKISSEEGIAESVYLTHDPDDNPVVVWTEKKNSELTLFFATLTDDGKSISKRTSIALSPDVTTHPEGMPKVAFKRDGSVIAAYEKKAPTKENKYAGTIYYVISHDGGKSWSGEAPLHSDTVSGKSRSYFDIERLPDGEIGASWLDAKLDVETGGRSVRFAKTAPSNGFSREILIDSTACQCCRIDVYSDDTENIFVAYRGLKKGDLGKQIRDMMIATSTDHGATFSTPVIISADNWSIDGCPHTGPSLCSNKAGLISLWYTEGSGTGIYYAQKNENGFTPRQLVSNDGHHPQLSAKDDRIAMVWEESTNNNGNPKTVVHHRIVRAGTEIQSGALTSAGDNAFLPVVAKTKTGFLVAYLMERGHRVGVYGQGINTN